MVVIKQNGRDNHKNVKWLCKCDCGNYTEVIGTHLLKGQTHSCGCIKSLGEEKIINILKQNNIEYIYQKTFENCRFPNTHALAKFDFYLPKHNIIIEYDGRQHFDKNAGWGENLNVIQMRDAFKTKWCNDNNIKLIRIPYTDFKTITIEKLLGDE